MYLHQCANSSVLLQLTCACPLCKQLKTPTGPLVGSLKQKFEAFALMSNQNSVFIREEKDLNAFAFCADAL